MKKMRKALAAIAVALAFTLAMPMTMPSNPVSVTAQAATIKLNRTSANLQVGNSIQLKVKGTSKTVKWTSSNKAVALVTSKGKVTGKAAGTAYIYAKVNNRTYSCRVTVVRPPINVSKISIDQTYDTGNGVICVMTNNTGKDIELTMNVTYYDENGGLIDTKGDSIFCFSNGSTIALKANGPCDTSYKDLPYASYKVILNADYEPNNMVNGYKNIDLKTDNSPAVGKLFVTATNAGSYDLSYIKFAVLYFDENGDIIDYSDRYAYCEKSGSSVTETMYYPSDENFHTIQPASYKVYLNEAYTYSWKLK